MLPLLAKPDSSQSIFNALLAAPTNGRNEVKNRVATCLLAAALVLVPALAGCKSPDVPQASGGKDITRVLNKKPKHVVQLDGRVPNSLQVRLFALYVTDTKDMSCFTHPGAKWGIAPNYHTEPLELSRANGRYKATLVVDKYLPGACNWTLAQVNADVGRTGKPDEEAKGVGQIIHAYYFYHDESDSSGCDVNARSGDHRKCPVEENALNTPVIIPCKVQSYDKNFPNTPSGFFCPDTSATKSAFKSSHRIKPGQTHVQIDFYDLDNEADPTK